MRSTNDTQTLTDESHGLRAIWNAELRVIIASSIPRQPRGDRQRGLVPLSEQDLGFPAEQSEVKAGCC